LRCGFGVFGSVTRWISAVDAPVPQMVQEHRPLSVHRMWRPWKQRSQVVTLRLVLVHHVDLGFVQRSVMNVPVRPD
jgi:hypothetical protein